MANKKRKRQAPLPPPQSPLVVTILCWVEGDRSPFAVDIDSNKIIAHLKEAILDKKPNLSITDASTLQLYLANIPDTKPGSIGFVFKDEEELLASRKLSSVFEGNPPKEEHIQIAIKRPGKRILSFPAEKANFVPQRQLQKS
jgi:hypothetical protein